jgi:hypothetical protein
MAYDWSGKQHRRIRFAKVALIALIPVSAIVAALILGS